MTLVKLEHPAMGLVAQKVVTSSKPQYAIEREWKFKYGKKFAECEVTVVHTYEPKRTKIRRVQYIETGDIYNTPKECADDIGVSYTMIYTHCNKLCKGGHTGFKYRFRFAD